MLVFIFDGNSLRGHQNKLFLCKTCTLDLFSSLCLHSKRIIIIVNITVFSMIHQTNNVKFFGDFFGFDDLVISPGPGAFLSVYSAIELILRIMYW